MAETGSAGPVLKLTDIRKTFDGVVAIESFSLDLHPGEIVALVGDNGAGKSTLIKIVSGVHSPDSGAITIEGKTVAMVQRQHGAEPRHRSGLPGSGPGRSAARLHEHVSRPGATSAYGPPRPQDA